MQIFRELTIDGPPNALLSLVEAMSRRSTVGWRRDEEAEERLRDSSGQYFAFDTELADGRVVTLWLYQRRNAQRVSVANVAPREPGEITRRQYNELVEHFHNKVLLPASAGLDVKIQMTTDTMELEDFLSPATAKRLIGFSRTANKWGLHPLDRERWYDFLIAAHRERTKLDATTLREWLTDEEGWPEETARELAIEFESGRDLLQRYDPQPVGA
jgi:hypothetical protein